MSCNGKCGCAKCECGADCKCSPANGPACDPCSNMMSKKQNPVVIAVDWGTSNFRAELVAADGSAIASVSNDGGMKMIAAQGGGALFEDHLVAAVGPWMDAHPALHVVMAGMIGSKQGWVEAPYLNCPVGAAAVASGLVSIPNSKGWNVWVLSGLTWGHNGQNDVMRGEEAQLLGLIERHALADSDTLVCLPGSHSKWAVIKQGGVIQSFKTFMTGEIFAILAAHSILKFSVEDDGNAAAAAASNAHAGSEAFSEGVRAGHAAPEELMHLCFMVRTKSLFPVAGRGPADHKMFLSGLLIGAELAGAGVNPATSPTVWLVGSSQLCARYEAALAVLGVGAKNDTAANTTAAGILAASRAAGIIVQVQAAAPAAPAALATSATSPIAHAPIEKEDRPATAKPNWWG